MKQSEPARLLQELHRAAHSIMIADVPSVKARMEFMHAWREAGKWLEENNEKINEKKEKQ
jgi:5-carboxymethyl-2-hydroxymuconate isomerase